MKTADTWRKGLLTWDDNGELFVSVVFTWHLPRLHRWFRTLSCPITVGGPAVKLMPQHFDDLPHVHVGGEIPGVLQRFNPQATRTSTGCVRNCRFCAVPKTEGDFRELRDWPDGAVICDNNLLACSQPQFDRVIDRLKAHGCADFNQGLDARLLAQYHANRIAEIPRAVVRLALDTMNLRDRWEDAFEKCREARIAKHRIRSYALIGFNTDPSEAWERCEWIERHGVKVLPMWFHSLTATEYNAVTPEQCALGWSDYERRRIMQWFYQHKKAVRTP